MNARRSRRLSGSACSRAREVAVDVPVECNDLGAQLSQDSRRRGRGHPVPAVDRDPEAVEIVPEPLRVRADRVEVAVEGVDALRLGPLVPRRRGSSPATRSSTARSASRSNSLRPSRNSLIPLSVGGLCEAVSITPYRPCEACASGGREPPGAEHPDAPGREARLHRGRDRRTRHASVTREDDLVGSRPLFSRSYFSPRRRPTANASSGVTRVSALPRIPAVPEQVHFPVSAGVR